ncbi:g11303 [Coccomyxa elongata]
MHGKLLLLCASALLFCSGLAASASNYTLVQPISVNRITFKPNSALAVPANLDRDFVAAIEPEELIWAFLRNTNASVDPKWRLRFKNSWEDPLEMNLAGEFTGDEALLGKAVQVVNYLSMAQEKLGGGYLYAYPEYHFERLSHQAETHIMSAMNDGWPWDVPFYVVTGYVACYEATGNDTCKAAVINFIDILLANHTWSIGGSNSDEHWGQPLQMGHFLLDDKVSGDDTRLTYSRLTQETCTSHNTVKILQAVFTWTMDTKYMDAMERLVYNGILGTQRMPVEREHHHDISFIDEWRLCFINASYDRTAEANTCTPAERFGENFNGIDIVKPGPSVRSYLTPMGDSITMMLPMVARLETLKDSRQHLQNYKSVIMGPFVLAGLTHDTSRVAIPSDDVADQLSAVDTAGLASILALPQKVYDKRNMCGDENHKDPYCRAEDIFTEALDGNGYYMKLDKRHVTAASDISTTADAMDATFRVVSAYNRGAALKALPFGTYPLGSNISLESMTMPGHFVGIDKKGVAVLEKDDGSPDFGARHTFIIREGNDGRSLGDNGITQATVSLELASSPGTFLLLPDQSQLDGKPRGDCMDSDNTDFPCSTFSDNMASPLLQSSQNPCQGTDRSYVLAPFHKVVEDRYTIYFDVQHS